MVCVPGCVPVCASVAVGFDHDGPEYFAKTFLKSEGLSGGRRKLG